METVLSKSDFAGKLAAMAPAVRMDGGAEASGAGEGGGEGFRPEFAPLSAQQMGGAKTQFRRVSAPPREDTPSKTVPAEMGAHEPTPRRSGAPTGCGEYRSRDRLQFVGVQRATPLARR